MIQKCIFWMRNFSVKMFIAYKILGKILIMIKIKQFSRGIRFYTSLHVMHLCISLN